MPSPQKVPKEDFYDGLMEAMRDGIASGVGNFHKYMGWCRTFSGRFSWVR